MPHAVAIHSRGGRNLKVRGKHFAHCLFDSRIAVQGTIEFDKEPENLPEEDTLSRTLIVMGDH